MPKTITIIARSALKPSNWSSVKSGHWAPLEVRDRAFQAGFQGKWLAYTYAPLIDDVLADKALEGQRAAYSQGWNYSFHDCQFNPTIMAWGRTPSRARKALKRALAALAPMTTRDTAVARMEARMAVRPGD